MLENPIWSISNSPPAVQTITISENDLAIEMLELEDFLRYLKRGKICEFSIPLRYDPHISESIILFNQTNLIESYNIDSVIIDQESSNNRETGIYNYLKFDHYNLYSDGPVGS